MPRTFFALFLLATPFGTSAQFGERAKELWTGTLPSLDSARTKGVKYSWTVFAEALGLGGDGSFNFDLAILGSKVLSPHLRAGFWDDRFTHRRPQYFEIFTIPVEAGVLIGRTHRVELNLGYTFELPVDQRADPDFFDDFTTLVASIGYRYQRRTGGLFGKIAFSSALTPVKGSIIDVKSATGYSVGLGLGYTFK